MAVKRTSRVGGFDSGHDVHLASPSLIADNPSSYSALAATPRQRRAMEKKGWNPLIRSSLVDDDRDPVFLHPG